jgi:hypothetical protein
MATKKKKKVLKKKLPVEPIVDRLVRELMNLSRKDQLDVVNRGMGVPLDTDNHGQIIIYTDMMYGDNDDVVAFETEGLKDHVEYEEEEHECEF